MKKFINKIIIICVIGISFLTGPVLGENKGYLSIKEVEVEWEGKGESKYLKVEVETLGLIPVDGKSGAFGYAALTGGGNNLLIIVTHLPIDDSSYETLPSGFHTHVLDLKKPSKACNGATFEVDLENSKNNTAFDADYKWKVKGHKISVKKVPVKDLADAGVESVVSFTLKPILDVKDSPTNLCVTMVDNA